MNVIDGVVSTKFLSDWIQMHDTILTPQIRAASRRESGWISRFVSDILRNSKGANEIILRGGQVSVVERMGDLPNSWPHWQLICDIKFQVDSILASRSDDDVSVHSDIFDVLVFLFKNDPTQGTISYATKVLARYTGLEDQARYSVGSHEYQRCTCIINHLNSLSHYYWRHKAGTYYAIQQIQSFMNQSGFILHNDLETIFSLAKGKILLWDRAEAEVVPGALVKVKSLRGKIGIVQTGLHYDPQHLSPYFVAIVDGMIIQVGADEYTMTQRRKKEKRIA